MFEIINFNKYFLIRCKRGECQVSWGRSNKGWVYSSPATDYCQGCKEKVPEHIRIQAKLLDPKKWGYL